MHKNNNKLIPPLSAIFTILLSFVRPTLTSQHEDFYLNEVRETCQLTKQPYTCAKYRLFDFVDSLQIPDFNVTSDSSVKIVGIPYDSFVGNSSYGARLTARSDNDKDKDDSWESEIIKMLKFLKRKVYKFLAEQGLAVDLPEGTKVLEDGKEIDTGAVESRSKKKKTLLLSFLILLNVVKIKVMMHGLTLGLFLVQKGLLIGAFFLAKAFAKMKEQCKSQHQYHPVPYYIEADGHYKHHYDHGHHYHDHHEEEAEVAGDTGYGYSGYEDNSGDFDHSKKSYFFDKLKKKLHLS